MGSLMPGNPIRDVKWRPVGQNNRYNFSSVSWFSVHEIIKDQKGPNGKVSWEDLLQAWREVLCQ